MFFDAELHFLQSVLTKSHIQTGIINPSEVPDKMLDLGLRTILEVDSQFDVPLYNLIGEILPRTIHMLTDGYECKYVYLLLPSSKKENVLVIGPYQTKTLTQQEILELAEKNAVQPVKMRDFEKFYSGLPVVSDENQFTALLDTFSEYIWNGSQNYRFKEYELETVFSDNVSMIINKSMSNSETMEINNTIIEKRYSYENDVLYAVYKGDYERALNALSKLAKGNLEPRNSDPVRDLKNYSIIMNTLFRKAVEKAGVHPVHIDRVSSEIAKKIELRNSTDEIMSFMLEMLKIYCQLVKKHSVKSYSPTVQKVIVLIEADLSANLTLSELAKTQNINASYLSTIFKNETGKNITTYVNEKRIELAEELLKSTNLQIQTIAQYCGIFDVHYFSRLFKKMTNKTPGDYRKLYAK